MSRPEAKPAGPSIRLGDDGSGPLGDARHPESARSLLGARGQDARAQALAEFKQAVGADF